MKQLGISLLAAVAFILTGCAAPIGQVTTNYDKFKDSSAEIVQVGQTVRLIRIAEKQQSPTYAFVVEGYSDGERVRTLSKFHCEESKACGVATAMTSGRGWNFDWSKCVHPVQAKRRG
jgi:hypothetical protein